jgi:hypothetical protein
LLLLYGFALPPACHVAESSVSTVSASGDL